MLIRIAILATDGFEQSELMKPRRLAKEAGFRVDVVSPRDGEIRGWNKKELGDTVPVDVPLAHATPDDYDALILPSGQMNPDNLRLKPEAVGFVRAFVGSDKPLAAICHAPWLLVDASAVEGKLLTSWPSLKTDLGNAGAQWQDAPVVTDSNLITSRKPDDIPQFTDAVIRALQ